MMAELTCLCNLTIEAGSSGEFASTFSLSHFQETFTMPRKIIVLLFLVLFITACSNRPKLERPEGMPELHPCSVTVTFGGTVMEGVTISLTPVEKDSQWIASGATDKNGTAIPCSSYGFKGVPEGKYAVAFTRLVTNPNYNENNSKSPYAQSLIPLKYGIGKSNETVEIKAGEKNKFSFALDAGEESVR
jgi:hypothetical protein